MSESMDKYYKEFLAGIAGAKVGSAAHGSGAGSLVAAAKGADAFKKAVQKKAKGGVVRKMKKGGKVK